MPVWRLNVRAGFADTVSASKVETAIARLDRLIKQVHPASTPVFVAAEAGRPASD
jgi:hypothetical protein